MRPDGNLIRAILKRPNPKLTIGELGDKAKSHCIVKGGMGYRGNLIDVLKSGFDIEPQCVKSNSETSDFRPIDDSWV